jgi:DNA-binding SARP family transcriptional activator
MALVLRRSGTVGSDWVGQTMEYRILGPLEVCDGERSLALRGPKQRALLAVLLLRRGQVVPADRLIEALWGDSPPATAAKGVQGHVSHLRKALGDELLVTRGGGYALAIAPGELDAERFERLAADGRRMMASGKPKGAVAALRRALGLWRGTALQDFTYDDFAAPEIARLEELRLGAIEERIDADLALGRHAEVVAELEALVRANPLRDRLRGQLMLALYRCGRQADALDRYQRGRQALVGELGLEPGRDLRELEQAILRQDPAIGPTGHHPEALMRTGSRSL